MEAFGLQINQTHYFWREDVARVSALGKSKELDSHCTVHNSVPWSCAVHCSGCSLSHVFWGSIQVSFIDIARIQPVAFRVISFKPLLLINRMSIFIWQRCRISPAESTKVSFSTLVLLRYNLLTYNIVLYLDNVKISFYNFLFFLQMCCNPRTRAKICFPWVDSVYYFSFQLFISQNSVFSQNVGNYLNKYKLRLLLCEGLCYKQLRQSNLVVIVVNLEWFYLEFFRYFFLRKLVGR